MVGVGLMSNSASAQLSLSTTAATENFNNIGSTATATLPSGWKVDKFSTNPGLLGTYSAALTATERVGADNLSTTAGNGIYNFGTGTSPGGTDRAVGFLSSGSGTKSGNLYAWYQATTDFTGITVSYDVEKYRQGSNSAGFKIQMYYSTDGSNWTSAESSFLTSFTADASNSGYTPAPGVTSSVTNQTITLSISSGSSLYLAWNYGVASGTTTTNAQALAIDNVSVAGMGGGGGPTTNYFGTTGQGGSTVWDTTTSNWSDKNDGTGTTMTWNATLATRFGGTAGTVTVNEASVAPQAGIYFDSTGYTLSGNTITLTTVPTVNVVNTGETATVNSQLSGSVGLAKGGAGTLVLGNAGNDFTGAVTVNGGALSVNDDAQLGNSANGIALSGGTLQTTASISTTRSFSGTGTLDIAPGTTLTSTGAFATSGVTLNNTGTLALSGGTPSVGILTITHAGATIENNSGSDLSVTGITTTHTSGTATVPGPIALTGSVVNVNVADGSAATDLALPGNIFGTGALNKLGTGTLLLTGDNSGLTGAMRQGVAGTTPTSGGVIAFDNAYALGFGQLQLNGGTLRNDSGTPLTLNNASGISLGASEHANTSGGEVFSGADMSIPGNLSLYLNLAHKLTVHNTVTVSGLGSPGTSTGLTIGGTGKLIINGDTSAFGTTSTPITVTDTASLVMGSGATLDLNIPVTVQNGASVGMQISLFGGSSYNFNGMINGNVSRDGGLSTVLDVLGGTASVDTILTALWTARGIGEDTPLTPGPQLPANAYNLISDKVDFSGTGGDTFVMSMSYDPNQIWDPNTSSYDPNLEGSLAAQGWIYLAWLDPSDSMWKNAALGNTGGGTNNVPNFQGVGTYAGQMTLGMWGVDINANIVWVVLNHNSEFAVVPVPEPATLALLAFGSLAVMRIRRKNKVTKA